MGQSICIKWQLLSLQCISEPDIAVLARERRYSCPSMPCEVTGPKTVELFVLLRFAQPRPQDTQELQPGIYDAVVVIELMSQNQNLVTPY